MISPFTEKIELLIKSLLENNSFAVVHYQSRFRLLVVIATCVLMPWYLKKCRQLFFCLNTAVNLFFHHVQL